MAEMRVSIGGGSMKSKRGEGGLSGARGSEVATNHIGPARLGPEKPP